MREKRKGNHSTLSWRSERMWRQGRRVSKRHVCSTYELSDENERTTGGNTLTTGRTRGKGMRGKQQNDEEQSILSFDTSEKDNTKTYQVNPTSRPRSSKLIKSPRSQSNEKKTETLHRGPQSSGRKNIYKCSS